MLVLGESRGGGFTVAGRVHIARSLGLSSFLNTRQAEGNWGPRSVAVLYDREPLNVSLDCPSSCIGDPGLLEWFYEDGLRRFVG